MLHGREVEEERKRDRIRHMLTAPTRANNNSVVAAPDFVSSPSSSSSLSSPADSFYKDGRKISVGDCALFKPPQDSPPFIGIIQSLTTGKENKLKLGVNWLYRPADIKLSKCILLEAAPNEVFFSFHKDEIPAASLLHPCKVAFLPNGVELPSGICSFVCRRVYDITNKCLWWLTDQDYINERQEVVDQLLSKTSFEMHATIQPGGCSPKTANGPTSTPQLKPGSDSVQNNASSFPSQSKGKKRDRGDLGSEPIKRERFSKMDDGDSVHRPESIWKSEISKFTEKGRLVDSEGVEKLVHLMLPDRNERKVDLVGRSILAGVIAVTDKFDCLNRFVQLRGVPVFDEWLQDVHKGKIGDGSSPKDGDKSAEEFLLVLLRALDKLPVNLHALQMCNIGKSVNNLRTHKNLEIQKKARSLVDTWKKRVEAEMDANAKSGSNQGVSWTARSRLPEVSHGGNRLGVSSEVATKSPVVQLSASKSGPVKLVQGDTVTKSASSPGPLKSAASPNAAGNNLKDGQPRNTGVSGAMELPVSSARDEKSSSSSQSYNNSQSCSSDHAKTVGLSGKEDARSSTAVSMAANKIIGGSLRHRKPVNGFSGPAVSGAQRDSGSSRSSPLHKNPGSEKLQQSSLACEKVLDAPMAEGNSNKFIVKIPNRGRSPAQSSSGGAFEDASVVNSRASSPVLSERHDQFDHNLKGKNGSYQANFPSNVKSDSLQSNDFKEVLTGSDERDGLPANVPDEEHGRMGDDARKLVEVSKTSPSLTVYELKFGKSYDASFSSMNALIESCAKYSEGNASMTVGDDVGMNLLASVAAGEMSKSDVVSPTNSPCISMSIERSCVPSGLRGKSSPRDDPAQSQCKSADGVDDEDEKRVTIVGTPLSKNTEAKTVMFSQEKRSGELDGPPTSSNADVMQTAEPFMESNVKSEETLAAAMSSTSMEVKTSNCVGKEKWEKDGDDGLSDEKNKLHSSVLTEMNYTRVQVGTEAIKGSSSASEHHVEVDGENNKNMNKEVDVSSQAEPKPPAMMQSDFSKGTKDEMPQPSSYGKDMVSENIHEVKAGETDGRSHSTEKEKIEHGSNMASAATDHESECKVESPGGNQGNKQCSSRPAAHKGEPTLQASEQVVRSTGSKLAGSGADETEECTSAAADASSLSATGGLDLETKVEFDLNEGFIADDGKYEESNNLREPVCSAAIQLISPFPLLVSSVSSGLPASITVAAAAKGPFVPPEDLLKSRGELGWKGSAATSAFRPAEPRKALEISLGTANVFSLQDEMVSKPGRPLLDIDLNVPDERILEDLAFRISAQDTASVSDLAKNNDCAHDALMCSLTVQNFGGFDLDLNRADEASDMGNHLTSIGRRLDAPRHPTAKSSSGGALNGEISSHRDFDLNDGPLVDEVSAEPSPHSQHTLNIVPSQSSISSLRINSTEPGSLPSWFPQGNPYPAVTIQSIIYDRGEQPFPVVATGGPRRMLAPSTGNNPFNPDIYRGAVLTSSPAVPFPSTPFQYPVFPFGTNFTLPSATFSGGSASYVDSSSGGRLCFPTVPSQVLAPVGALSSHYPRPSYAVNLPDINNNGDAESSRKWVRQGLDLNAGPLGPDFEGRDEISALASRQLSVASSPALAEEQSRMYQVTSGGVRKRKEPEGGWEGYKQSSWH
ncbi:BAH AND TFIIS DOMAIN-CONTAINING PROTEIN-RELATED [Salix viminalis]|uniref:BAH AND TFIIS DOMAIN-CONTAINING PROTEIN-RELATED n=1 Tax=Salix viminalis TaxID=40686 RepID=A0A9Q0NMM6_SALVM|nr:BAH AND TFIIS DOMAIN-CONTAINING PROTEIN-RELATED [Salix viminalis]